MIAVTVAVSMILMLIAGVYAMYETRGFWGLESNSNACTLNNTFNAMSDSMGTVFPVVMILIVSVIVICLFSLTRRAF